MWHSPVAGNFSYKRELPRPPFPAFLWSKLGGGVSGRQLYYYGKTPGAGHQELGCRGSEVKLGAGGSRPGRLSWWHRL